jgi:hypothetical protein
LIFHVPIIFELSSDDISVRVRAPPKQVAKDLHSKANNGNKVKKEKEGNALFRAFFRLFNGNSGPGKEQGKQKNGNN